MALIRLYTVQMGTLGASPSYKSHPMPIYLARRKAMQASPELTEYFKNLPAGQIVFGHLVRLKDQKFIAIVEQGRTYHTAGEQPISKESVGYVPPRHPDEIPIGERGETFRRAERRTTVPRSHRQTKRQSEAERIAARMAAAGRKAAEGAPKEES